MRTKRIAIIAALAIAAFVGLHYWAARPGMLMNAVKSRSNLRVGLLLLLGASPDGNYSPGTKTYGPGWNLVSPLGAAVQREAYSTSRLILLFRPSQPSKDQALRDVCLSSEDAKLADLLLSNGANPSYDCLTGSPLLVNVRGVTLARLLVRYGADIKARDSRGRTALHNAAAVCPTPAMAAYFIGLGLDINSKDKQGGTPLDGAVCVPRRSATVRYLRAHGARMSLAAAAGLGDVAAVEHLLDEGADVNASAGINGTPLHYAARAGNVAIVALLLKSGAKVDATAPVGTPLYVTDNLVIARMLVQHHASLLSRGYRQSPLHSAIEDKHFDIARMLVKRGADLTARDVSSSTPLHAAAASGSTEMVKFLLDRGASAKAVNQKGSSPLHEAATGEIAQLLIARGAHIGLTNKNYETPLICAAQHGSASAARVLIAHGASVALDRSGHVGSLHCAANRAVAEVLIEHGAAVNAKDWKGETPIFSAVRHNNLPVADLLISQGADLRTRNQFEETPLGMALSFSNRESAMARLLQKHGAAL